MKECLFCKIINRKAPSKIVYEDNRFTAFKNIKPVAPVHLLIVPQKHIPTINHLKQKDRQLIGELFLIAKKIAQEQGLSKRGYRLIINFGKDSGQTIEHLHLHLIGGKKLPWA